MKYFLCLIFSLSIVELSAEQSSFSSSSLLIAQAEESNSQNPNMLELIRQHRSFRKQQSFMPAQTSPSSETTDFPGTEGASEDVEGEKDTPTIEGVEGEKDTPTLFPLIGTDKEGESSGSTSTTEDKKAIEMIKCFKDITDVLNKRQREELIKKDPSAKEYISCDNPYKSFYSTGIWFSSYPERGYCRDTRNTDWGFGMSGNVESISESEKTKSLSQCKEHLDKVKKGENPIPPAPAVPKLDDPKAEEMVKCFGDIENILNKRHKEELVKKDPSAKGHIKCSYRFYNKTVWFSSYPERGYCSDTRKGIDVGGSYGKSYGYYDLSESEKTKRLELCKEHLNKVKKGENPIPPAPAKLKPAPLDPKAVEMRKCFSNINDIKKIKEKEKLVAKGSKPINIICDELYLPDSSLSSIWDRSYPQPFCWDITNKDAMSNSLMGMSSRDTPISEDEKDKKLEECFKHVNALLSKSNIPDKQEALAKCLKESEKVSASIKTMLNSGKCQYNCSYVSSSYNNNLKITQDMSIDKQARVLKNCENGLRSLKSRENQVSREWTTGGNR